MVGGSSGCTQKLYSTGNTKYPCVPGHEVVGVVSSVGEGVTGYEVFYLGVLGNLC